MAEKIKSWGWNEPVSALQAETAPSHPLAASGPWGGQVWTKVRPFLNLLAAGPHAVGWEWLGGVFSAPPPFPKVHFNTLSLHPNFFGEEKKKK